MKKGVRTILTVAVTVIVCIAAFTLFNVLKTTHRISDFVTVKTETVDYFDLLNEAFAKKGDLVTLEYTFTDEYSSESVKTIFGGMELPFTRNECTLRYNGNIRAGIDCTKIVIREASDGVVVVSLPKARIMNASLDMDSVEIVDEKDNILNRIDVEHVIDELSNRLDEQVEAVSEETDLLETAESRAEDIIEALVKSICGTDTVVSFR